MAVPPTPGDRHTPVRAAVNRSGYPFQLAVENAISAIPEPDRWQFLNREVPHTKGFLDLTAHRGVMEAMIECKRYNDQSWTFLVPEGSSNNVNRIRVEVALHDGVSDSYGTQDLTCAEGTYESEFCAIHGASGNLTLEKIAGELLIASGEIALMTGRMPINDIEVFLPIIVTTAALHVCRYDPANLGLREGAVDPHAPCEDVGVIRFRKTLVPIVPPETEEAQLIRNMAQIAERTVFVVSGTYVATFMKNLARYGIRDQNEDQLRLGGQRLPSSVRPARDQR